MGLLKKLLFWRRRRNVAITTRDIATQTVDLDKIKDDCADKERKKAAALRKLVELREKEIAAMQKFLDFKDGIILKQRAVIQQMKELQGS